VHTHMTDSGRSACVETGRGRRLPADPRWNSASIAPVSSAVTVRIRTIAPSAVSASTAGTCTTAWVVTLPGSPLTPPGVTARGHRGWGPADPSHGTVGTGGPTAGPGPARGPPVPPAGPGPGHSARPPGVASPAVGTGGRRGHLTPCRHPPALA